MASVEVVCAGEVMVDFLPEKTGQAVRDTERWRRCSGGAVANVAVGLARLGVPTAMCGVVGADEFGAFLSAQLKKEGVDVARLRQTDEGKTGLAFVSLDPKGERSFAFFRTRAADLFLNEADVDEAQVRAARAVVFGTNSLLFRDAQRAVLKLARVAREAGVTVVCDPNIRPHLWPSANELQDLLTLLIPHCHVVKVTEEELQQVTGQTDLEGGLRALHEQGVELPLVTLGARGAAFLWKEALVRVPAPTVTQVDPTGAGDGFMAGLVYGLTSLYRDAAALRFAGVGELRELVKLACAVGSRVVGQLGAVDGLPTRDQVRS